MTQTTLAMASNKTFLSSRHFLTLAALVVVLAGCAVVPPPGPPPVAYYPEYPPYPATYWSAPQVYLGFSGGPAHHGGHHRRHHRH